MDKFTIRGAAIMIFYLAPLTIILEMIVRLGRLIKRIYKLLHIAGEHLARHINDIMIRYNLS